MEYRQLGSSGVKVTPVTFGAWAIGGWQWGPQDDQDALAALNRAIEVGMTSIDTAPIYGFGHSEVLVGHVLREHRRQDVQVLTKYGMRWDRQEGVHSFDTLDNDGRPLSVYRNSRPDRVIEECEQSLRRLGTDYIDLYQCHWRDPSMPLDETMGAMQRLLEQGKILAAGVSNFTVEEIDACRKAVPVASDQPPYSMLNRAIEADLLPWCIEQNVGILAYSPLQRGLLTGKVAMDRTFPPGDGRASSAYFRPDNRQRVLDFLDAIRPIARDRRCTLAQLVLAWTIRREGITVALVGARNPAQVDENAAAVDVELSGEEIAQINERLDELKLDVDGPF